MKRVLIVGAGLSGAVHARELADAGHRVDVIDKRSHIGGNCYDYVHRSGTMIHRYGPHLFHTSNTRVVEWLSRFTEWTPYTHRVSARLPDGRCVPMPINLDTVNAVFGKNLSTPDDVSAELAARAIVRHPISNAEDHLYATIGPELTNLFFRPYTRKMWGMELSQTSASIVQRLKIRNNTDSRYFPDDVFQALPKQGYTAMFGTLLNHKNISITLNCAYHPGMEASYDGCFNSMPIDEHFDFVFGELPYRSIKFHLIECPRDGSASHTTLNYTDDGPFTRETLWHNIAGLDVDPSSSTIATIEEPCDYKENCMERYYPVQTSDNRHGVTYKKYKSLSEKMGRMQFIGRCGTYQYLDMHQVVNQALVSSQKWLES